MIVNFKILKLIEVYKYVHSRLTIIIIIIINRIELNFLIPESSNHHRCHHLV
jgi:hypothetical protein